LLQRFPGIFEPLTDDLGMTGNGHKIRVTIPPGNNVNMEMILYSGAGNLTNIDPDIEALGIKNFL
jgi:hypothetical protein